MECSDVKIALDPTPFHHSHGLLEFPRVVADLGYEYMQMTPHRRPHPVLQPPEGRRRTGGPAQGGLQGRRDRNRLRPAGAALVRAGRGAREAAVRYWKRAIQIAVDLGVSTMNTEFSGRPEKAEESERAFYRSMEELLPIIEREGIDLLIDPHPDDFVEEGLAAIRVIRGLNSKNVGLVYVASTPST